MKKTAIYLIAMGCILLCLPIAQAEELIITDVDGDLTQQNPEDIPDFPDERDWLRRARFVHVHKATLANYIWIDFWFLPHLGLREGYTELTITKFFSDRDPYVETIESIDITRDLLFPWMLRLGCPITQSCKEIRISGRQVVYGYWTQPIVYTWNRSPEGLSLPSQKISPSISQMMV